MSWIRGLAYRMRTITRRARVRRERDEERAFHVDMQTSTNIATGVPPHVARVLAEQEFAMPDQSLLAALTTSEPRTFAGVGRDVRVSWRSLRRDPVFAVLSLLTLAVGIGATTAIFTVVNAVLLRPLPYPAPDRLVALWQVTPASDRAAVSIPNFRDWQTEARSFSAMATFRGSTTTVLGGDEPTRAEVFRVSGDFFRVLGASPALGRLFLPEDARSGAAPVAVVSQSFWRRALAGGELTSRRVELAGRVFDVVGVMPDEAVFPDRAEVWIPRELFDGEASRDGLNDAAIARLAPSASISRAQQELSGIAARLWRDHRQDNPAFDARVIDLQRDLVGKVRDYLRVLLGAVAFVLLVAAVNLTSASLARGTTRGREMAIRLALGSGRARLVRQLLTESTMLAVAGGVAGVGVAAWLVRVLVRLAPASIPRPAAIDLDATVLAFAAGVSVLTGLLIGLAPAVFSSDISPATMLGGGRGTVGDARNGLRRVLVGAEVALALVLLAAAGLLLRSFATLVAERPGFDTGGALVADLALPSSRYPDATARLQFYDGLLERLRALPGVQTVAATSTPPLSWGPNGAILVEDRPGETGQAHYRVVSGEYFRALGVALVNGRSFVAADDSVAPHVAVVNETFARQTWPGGNAMGKRVRFRGMDAHNETWLTVVGVARDAKQIALDVPPVPEVYVSYRQRPERTAAMSIVVRASAGLRLAAAIRGAAREQGSDVPVTIGTMEERVARSVADRRFVMLILTAFGVVALLLAAVGIYGVLSYSVARRTKEIGVRVALGARATTVLGMIVGDSMRPVLWGALLGIAGALAVSRVLRGLVYGVGVTDPLTFGVATVVLLAVALVASWVPARRASRVDPIIALRAD
jgi:predicted permease